MKLTAPWCAKCAAIRQTVAIQSMWGYYPLYNLYMHKISNSPNPEHVARVVGVHTYLKETSIMSNTINTIDTIASFTAYAQSCPLSTIADLNKLLKGKTLQQLAGAHVRTENAQIGIISSLYHVTRGIIETLTEGQKSKLGGFEAASRRVGGGFTALVALGATAAESAAAAARAATAVILSLNAPRIVRSAVFGAGGIAEGARPGTLLIDMSSIDPESTTALAADAS